MILVTGATGKVGSIAARLLAESGQPVRALVRDPGKAAGLQQSGAQIAVGDFNDPAALAGPSLGGAVRPRSKNTLLRPALPTRCYATTATCRTCSRLAPAVRKTDSFGLSAGNGEIGMIDTRDIGAAEYVKGFETKGF